MLLFGYEKQLYMDAHEIAILYKSFNRDKAIY